MLVNSHYLLTFLLSLVVGAGLLVAVVLVVIKSLLLKL
jgi:hypothetical protein